MTNRREFFTRVLGTLAAAKIAPKLIETPQLETIGYSSPIDSTGATYLWTPHVVTLTTNMTAATHDYILKYYES
jgi:hypothetical protein